MPCGVFYTNSPKADSFKKTTMQKTTKKYSMINVQFSMFKNRKNHLLIGIAILLIANCLSPITASAQKDTLKKKSTIDINSVYKPVLRNAVKINFSATHLNADTTAPNLTYSIPAQNLFYSCCTGRSSVREHGGIDESGKT